jgi:DNA processing protein
MNLEKLHAYLKLNAVEHWAGAVLHSIYENGYEVEEIAAFSRNKWEEFFSKRKCDRIFRTLLEFRVEEELEYALENGIGILPMEDPDYPELLKEIFNPPRVLFYLGKLPPRGTLHLSVVGARDASVAGKCNAEDLGMFLASQGISVVSGFARGIDRAVHRGCMQRGGYVTGIIGSGIAEFVKPALQDFYVRALRNGVMFSEFPVKFPVFKRNYPLRNRIITGMSLGTVIVEAKIRSGSMVSARHALEQGREVFAIPGPINSETAQGPNSLIRSGAVLVSRFEDIVLDLGLPLKPAPETQPLTPEEEEILELLTKSPRPVDDLVYNLQKPLAKLSPLLLSLERKQRVARLPGDMIRSVL